jgi:hypothetical protein
MDAASLQKHMPIIDGYPRPNWHAIGELISQLPEEQAHERWCFIARVWVDAIAEHAGPTYQVSETSNFIFLTTLDARGISLVQKFVEKAWKQVLKKLPDLGEVDSYGKRVLLLFHNADAYYEYTTHFYPEGEHPMSAGVFLNVDYGHIAMPFHDLSEAEGTLAHELTHNYLRLLPIPLWLDEGIAVTMEAEICNYQPFGMSPERKAEHKTFWNEDTIQEFWSGQSFGRVDEGNSPSYELARYCIRVLTQNLPSFIEFARRASFEDGGESAAVEIFEGSLAGVIEPFLGPGNWGPRAA